MADHGAASPHGSGTIVPSPDGHGAETNPEVRYERSDVDASSVLWFVGVLSGILVLSGLFLTGLFQSYETREANASKLESLPLAAGDRAHLPVSPRLEGIDPTDDVGRAWPMATSAEGPLPWFGYNVRVVPQQGPRDSGTDAEERDRQAARAMARTLIKIDAELTELAGKLPARAMPAPVDILRRSAGDGNGGRSAGEKLP